MYIIFLAEADRTVVGLAVVMVVVRPSVRDEMYWG